MMGIFSSLSGTVRVELTSADVAGSVHNINRMNIPVSDFQFVGDLTVQFTVFRRHYRRIQKIAQAKGESVSVISNDGIIWPILGLRKRPVLLAGVVLFSSLTLFLPSRILFVKVEGNESIPSGLILEVADEAGINFGASRRAVRSEKMKNELLGALPELQWAGVNTYGCTAVISVRERTPDIRKQSETQISSVVAAREGVVTSCTIVNGTGLCNVGQAVQMGQKLISAYTDCGGIITARRAEGEVFAQTRRKMRSVSSLQVRSRVRLRAQKANFALCIGKKRINFYKGSGIYDGSCVKMITRYQLALPGDFELPVTLIKEQYCAYQMHTKQNDEKLVSVQMSEFSKSLLRNDGIALSILDAKETVIAENGLVCLNGVYTCNEMIGRQQAEQNGAFHGKTD